MPDEFTLDIDEITADVPRPSFATKRKPGRPPKAAAVMPKSAVIEAEGSISEEPLPHEVEFLQPVGITFLAKVTGKQVPQITKKMAKCPVIGWHDFKGRKHPLYDFMTAMSYLVAPRGDIEDWFGQQNAASLPPAVSKMFWDMATQRNRAMLAANQLWHTEDVQMILGRIEIEIRQRVKMWIEQLPGKEEMPAAQYHALTDASNELLEAIRLQVQSLPDATLPMSDTIRDEVETAPSKNMPRGGDDEA